MLDWLWPQVSELGGIPLMLKASDMSNTIPDERIVMTYVSYLCARLLDLRQEARAARVIQLAWRRFRFRQSLALQQVVVSLSVIFFSPALCLYMPFYNSAHLYLFHVWDTFTSNVTSACILVKLVTADLPCVFTFNHLPDKYWEEEAEIHANFKSTYLTHRTVMVLSWMNKKKRKKKFSVW